jgi:hypothetical protein
MNPAEPELYRLLVKAHERGDQPIMNVVAHFDMEAPKVQDEECTVTIGGETRIEPLHIICSAFFAFENSIRQQGARIKAPRFRDDECHAMLQRFIDFGFITGPGEPR